MTGSRLACAFLGAVSTVLTVSAETRVGIHGFEPLMAFMEAVEMSAKKGGAPVTLAEAIKACRD